MRTLGAFSLTWQREALRLATQRPLASADSYLSNPITKIALFEALHQANGNDESRDASVRGLTAAYQRSWLTTRIPLVIQMGSFSAPKSPEPTVASS